jgi:hypothetical protein
MPEIALRPRSATELVDAAFQVYRRAPLQFMVALAVVYVPSLVLRLVFDINIDPANMPPPSTLATFAIIAFATYAIAGGAITVVARDVYLDHPVSVAEAYRIVATRLVTLVLVSVITVVLMTISAMLLLLPALYVIARFVAVRQTVVLEDAGTGRALSRSSALTVGLKMHVLGTLALMFVLVIAVNVGAGLLINLIPSRVIMNVLSTALSVVVGPILGITETVLYYDLRIRREGFDLEYLVGQHAAPPAGSADVAL